VGGGVSTPGAWTPQLIQLGMIKVCRACSANQLIEDGLAYEVKMQRLWKPFPPTCIHVRDALASFSGLLQWLETMKVRENRPAGFDDESPDQEEQGDDCSVHQEEEEPPAPAGLTMSPITPAHPVTHARRVTPGYVVRTPMLEFPIPKKPIVVGSPPQGSILHAAKER
jgi:hypothetical protein